MSFEVDGVLFTPDYKAKERLLRKIIVDRENDIAVLKQTIDVLTAENTILRARKEKKEVKKKEKVNKVRRARYLKTRKGWVEPND